MASFAQTLAIESWILYGIGILLILCRMVSRRIQVGFFNKLQLDDWIMALVTFTFTGVIVSTNQVANNGSNYLPPGAAELLTPEEVVSAIWGSKLTLVLEEFTLFTTWLIKACVLLMYSRLTLNLKQNVLVKFLAWYCAFGFIVVQSLYLGVWCKPIEQYWAVPVANSQCATYYNHMITATVFNVSSDLMMLLVPLPLLIVARLPLKRKIILCFVFSLGIFVILAAILNRYYNFTVAYSPIFLNWYVGEVSTAVFVSNIPLCWPLMQRIFGIDAFGNSKRSGSNSNTNPDPHNHSASGKLYSRSIMRSKGDRLPSTTSNIEASESEERIARSWAPELENQLELRPVDPRTGFKVSVAAGNNSHDGPQNWNESDKEAIVQTFQISQYSS